MIRHKIAVVITGVTLLSYGTANAHDIRVPVRLAQNRVNPVSYHASQKSKDVNAVFMSALKAGHFEKAKALLEAGADPCQKAEYNKTVLMLALQSHRADADLVRMLLKTNDVNQRNNYNECAITIACSSGVSVEIIKLLLEHGADKNSRCVHGHNLLFITLFGSIENSPLVRYLLSIGFDSNEKDKNDGYALELAMKRNKMSSARELVRAGANLSVLSDEERKKLEPHLKRIRNESR
jgi:FOG: Ankyrin repeat